MSSAPGERPLVSVVTITFNALEALERTIDSVAKQTFDNFEHIVIDGASTDGTPEYLAHKARRIRWISEPDAGIADALNKALAMARGYWMLVLHADDTFADINSLERAASDLERSDSDIVGFDVLFLSADSNTRLRSQGLSSRLLLKTSIPHQGAFISRRLHDRIGLYDTDFNIAMDYEFFLRAKKTHAKAETIPIVIANMPDSGVSSRRDWPSLKSRFSEERRVQLKHAQSSYLRLCYACYWPVYLAYRKLIWVLKSR